MSARDQHPYGDSFALLCAARYMLGRQSAGVSIITTHIAARLPTLTPGHRAQLASEIRSHVAREMCGAPWDCARWVRLADILEATV